MTAPGWFFLCLAALAYGMMFHAVSIALKPQRPANPDWFWTGGAWVRADEGVNVSWVQSIELPEYESSKPEPSDLPESKPESGAG